MASGEAILRSPLDKPLGQLTEEDISQLTREDCRRYLKEKGMRRPSWNKSQAIEQVISLKTLLEPRSDSDALPEDKIHAGSRTDNAAASSDVPGKSFSIGGEHQISVSANESVSYRRKDLPKPSYRADVSCRSLSAATSPRNTTAADGMASQMTIFYCGKVNVYDGIPINMAKSIMQLAASPVHVPQDSPPATTATLRLFPRQLQAESTRPVFTSAVASPFIQNTTAENSQQYREEGLLSQEVDPECPARREVSLQRYLEKRKDRGRFKCKKKVGASSCSSLEMYLNHQIRGQNLNEQSSRSGTSSPTQPRQLHAPSNDNVLDDRAKTNGLSVDLNDNGAFRDDSLAEIPETLETSSMG